MAAAGQKQPPGMTQHHHDIGRRSDHETHDQRPVLALLAAAQAHHLERGVDAGDVDRLLRVIHAEMKGRGVLGREAKLQRGDRLRRIEADSAKAFRIADVEARMNWNELGDFHQLRRPSAFRESGSALGLRRDAADFGDRLRILHG